jgi:DNA-binding CsgD family transcriptional regulator
MKKNGGRKVISPELLKYCTTDYQREIIELYMELGTSRAVGEEIGIKERTVRAIVSSIEANAGRI